MTNPLANDLDHVLAHTEELWKEVRGERFFLTGGTGFVGVWLTESLVWANRRLGLGISAVLLTRKPRAFEQRCPHLAGDPAVTLHAGDAVSFEYPDGSFPLMIHAATEKYAAPSPKRPAYTFDRDVAGTHRVLDMARTCGARRFLFTSSGAVYGKQPSDVRQVCEGYVGSPLTTDTNSAYGQSKRISEFLCSSYARACGFDALVARLFTFVGPYLPLDEHYAIGNFIGDAFDGGPVRVSGDGTPYRSYLYAADLAIWLWTILFRGKTAAPYNVGSPDEISILDLAQRVVSSVAPGTPIRLALQPVTGARASRYVPSTQRAEETLGLRPWVPLEEGIRRTYDWYAGVPAEAGATATAGATA
jgi:nucleoside-diphosphate-sugar epimerase